MINLNIKKISIVVILVITAIFTASLVYGFTTAKNKPISGIMIKRIDMYGI